MDMGMGLGMGSGMSSGMSWRITVFSAISALCALTIPPALAQTQADPEAATAAQVAPKPLAQGDRSMIVAANPHAAKAGAAVLFKGGSAADAAIAAQLVLNVVEPQSSGLGGGAFALYWRDETQTLDSWDGRETAPAAAAPDRFLKDDGEPMRWPDAVATGRGVGVPGLPQLLWALHQTHGELPWAELAAPAIALAEDGFEISPRLAGLIAQYQERLAATQAASVFLDPDGAPLPEGTLLKQPLLAETLRAYAETGPAAFTTGPIADAILEAVNAEPMGGGMTLEDLASYEVKRRRPLCLLYRAEFEICGMGPPSSGGATVGMIMGLLDHFPIPAMPPESPQAWALFAEASRLAYADRDAYLADSDHVSVPAAGLLDPVYLTLRAQQIGYEAGGKAAPGNPPWREGRARLWAPDTQAERPATTHISVVDSAGDALSLTSSIETAFGSARMAAGLLLNNQLTDFSFRPEIDGRPVANAVAPGKRPRSSMAPTIVLKTWENDRQRPYLVLGSPGGSRIIEYVAGALVRSLDWDLPANEAVAGPHVSQRNRETTVVETRPDADPLAAALAAAGHEVERRDLTSGLHLIELDIGGRMQGGADPRREGEAIGDWWRY